MMVNDKEKDEISDLIDQLDNIIDTFPKDLCRQGRIMKFGRYKQSSDILESIEWEVLDVKDGKALLFATKILDAHRFDEKNNDYFKSEIRKWLNGYFFNKAFNEEEKDRIVPVNLDANESFDKVFLLSEKDITNPEYGFDKDGYSSDLKCIKYVTDYALKRDAFAEKQSGNGWYFLRTASTLLPHNDLVYGINFEGYCNSYYDVFNKNYGVVPAIWIEI